MSSQSQKWVALSPFLYIQTEDGPLPQFDLGLSSPHVVTVPRGDGPTLRVSGDMGSLPRKLHRSQRDLQDLGALVVEVGGVRFSKVKFHKVPVCFFVEYILNTKV